MSNKSSKPEKMRKLFIEELEQVSGGSRSGRHYIAISSYAAGEEDGLISCPPPPDCPPKDPPKGPPDMTTMAIGEEDGGSPYF
jgi:hypothetical protein